MCRRRSAISIALLAAARTPGPARTPDPARRPPGPRARAARLCAARWPGGGSGRASRGGG